MTGKKTGGRIRGTPNKTTAEERDRVTRILDLIEDEYLEDDIAMLDPDQRTTLYRHLIEYKIPKLARTEHVGDPDNPVNVNITNLPQMSTDQLLRYIDSIQKQVQGAK